ncbi:MAG: DUF4159 domain-containing protein [Planctomycetota bacterium]
MKRSKNLRWGLTGFCLLTAVGLLTLSFHHGQLAQAQDAESAEAGEVRAANLIYGTNRTSVCFADQFLTDVEAQTNIKTNRRFFPVQMESEELFEYPFAVMTGEGAFTLSQAQRDTLKDYLNYGGFVIASAGCSSRPWNESFRREMQTMFPEAELAVLDADHAIYHTVYDISSSRYKRGETKLPELYAMQLEGRVVMVWSPDGLNDSSNAGPNCCCCGGNEVKSAKQLNVNILAYALTH